MKNLMVKQAFKAAFPCTIPVLVGYLFLSSAIGIYLAAKGFGLPWAIGCGLIAYSGAMQFVLAGMLTMSFDPINAVILTLTVNGRHLFYGLPLLKQFSGAGILKPYMMFALTDETFSLQCSVTPPEGIDEDYFRFFICLLNHTYWMTGQIIGNLIGTTLNLDMPGLDFVMTALFAVLFVEQWDKYENRRPIMIAAAIAVITLLIFGPDTFIVIAMMMIIGVLLLYRPILEPKPQKRTHQG